MNYEERMIEIGYNNERREEDYMSKMTDGPCDLTGLNYDALLGAAVCEYDFFEPKCVFDGDDYIPF